MAPRRDLLFLDTSFHTTKPSSAQPALKHSSAAWEHAISTTNYLHNCNAYVPRSAPDPYARCCTDKAKRSKLISSLRHRPPREPQQPWHLRQQYEIGGGGFSSAASKGRQCHFSLQQAPSRAGTPGFEVKRRMAENKARGADRCRGNEPLPCRELLVWGLPPLFFINGKMNQ